tara:strand:+ start:19944 stop:20642 length:699 start_codon:yes stop_codon:yes gene_type:complete
LTPKDERMNLQLDHFYFALDDETFDQAREFFCQFPFTESYSVQAKHGSWEGIYPFQRDRSAYPEFVRASSDKIAGCIGMCFGNLDETSIHEKLVAHRKELGWIRKERFREDGSKYFISSIPSKQGSEVYFWGIEWQGNYVEKRENWGADSGNPLIRVKQINLTLSSETMDLIEEYRDWLQPTVVLCDAKGPKRKAELVFEIDESFEVSDREFTRIKYQKEATNLKVELEIVK